MSMKGSISERELNEHRHAIGRRMSLADDISPMVTERFAAVGGAPVEQTPLRHWAHFLAMPPREDLGEDGHPKRGRFIPAISLPRRMYAAGHIDFLTPFVPGAPAEKDSVIGNIEHKTGRSGEMVFVTIEHKITQGSACRLREMQTLVYRNAAEISEGAANGVGPLPQGFRIEGSFLPTSVDLFRFSSVTLNSHRIHYDRLYAREAEGYPDLVVHGPFVAVMLANLAQAKLGKPLTRFSFRAKAPLFVNRLIEFAARPNGDSIDLCAINPNGNVAVEAAARG